MASVREFVRSRWEPYSRLPFPTLLRVFLGRVFHGGGDSQSSEMDVALGVVLILLALPGVLVSLLLFEKYGSLIRWMRGEGAFDPFTATIPDEYFFIVLSMVVTGAAAVWRWDALFLDRRDYTNIVPLPVSLRRIFLANLAAIFLLAAVLTLDVNAASFFLFPIAVLGSQNSLGLLLRFAAGHALTVMLASAFSFLAVFALIGLLMALLPYSAFRKVSVYVRFVISLIFVALLVTSFSTHTFLGGLSRISQLAVNSLPPVWFLGIGQSLWGRHDSLYFAAMARTAYSALGIALVVAFFSYALSFRRSFARIPETAETGPLPRWQFRFLPTSLFDRIALRDLQQRACFHFISRTFLRSEAHLQIASGAACVGLVASAQSIASIFPMRPGASLHAPSEEFFSVPYILAFCILLGIRFAFEVPSNLRSNWVFALWIDTAALDTRAIARKVLLTFSLIPLVPVCFFSSWILWNLRAAFLHSAIFGACTIAFVELLLVRFRKIPFTCTYPPFQSQSALTFVACLFGFILFTSYLPELDVWSVAYPWRATLFFPLFGITLLSVHFYRKQMLDMDKHLIFEDPSPSLF